MLLASFFFLIYFLNILSFPFPFLSIDKVVLPPDLPHTRAFSEFIVYLPGGAYQPQDELQGVGVGMSVGVGVGESTITKIEQGKFREMFFFSSLSLLPYLTLIKL